MITQLTPHGFPLDPEFENIYKWINTNPHYFYDISMSVNAAAMTLDFEIPNKSLMMWLPDPDNAGSYIQKTITAPSTIYGDGHASENFNLGEAGQTLAVAWSNNYPITWYWTIKSGVVYWVCSRNPCMTNMPASGNNIGDFDAAPVTSNQSNVFVAASITEADFVDLPVWPIGTMPITRAAASSIPTLVALTAGVDGFGLWTDSITFDFPTGQNGATSGTYLSEEGASTLLRFGSETFTYESKKNGDYHIHYQHCSRTAADASVLICYLHLPAASSGVHMICQSRFVVAGTSQVGAILIGDGNAYGNVYSLTNGNQRVSNFTGANDYFAAAPMSGIYKSFTHSI